MRNIIKTFVYISLRVVSVFLVPWQRAPHVFVLMYHSVADNDWKLSVSVKQFEKQMKYLAERYTSVPFSDVVDFIEGRKKLRNNSIVLTFDDGYEDTYEIVFPLIKKYHFPATIFLTTNLKKIEKLGDLERIKWEQVKEMQDSGLVTFEVHGKNHINLIEAYNNNTINDEIAGCAEDLKQHIGYDSKFCAYPFGYKNNNVISFLKKHGFLAVASINEGIVKKGDNPFMIKRIQVDKTMNFMLFKARLTKAVELNRSLIDSIRRYAKKT